MQNEPVVAETVFLLSCWECFEPLGTSFGDQQVCSRCKVPQVLRGESYFAIFQVALRFRQNAEVLESRFYEASRVLHPDRFSHAEERVRKLSLERMSFLNTAYEALRHPETLREALLECWGLKADADVQMQPEIQVLAEEWFEVQSDQALIAPFYDRVKQVADQIGSEMKTLEESYDRSEEAENFKESQVILKKLMVQMQLDRYLRALMQQCFKKMA